MVRVIHIQPVPAERVPLVDRIVGVERRDAAAGRAARELQNERAVVGQRVGQCLGLGQRRIDGRPLPLEGADELIAAEACVMGECLQIDRACRVVVEAFAIISVS